LNLRLWRIYCPEASFDDGLFTTEDVDLMLEKGYFLPGTRLERAGEFYDVAGSMYCRQRKLRASTNA